LLGGAVQLDLRHDGIPIRRQPAWRQTASISPAPDRSPYGSPSAAAERKTGGGPDILCFTSAQACRTSCHMSSVFPWTMEQTGDVIDATCHLWRIQDIREATVGVFIFTMLFTAILAALQLPSPGNERTAASAIRDRRHDP